MSEESDDETAPTPTNDSDPPVHVVPQPIAGTPLQLYPTTRWSRNDDQNIKDVQEDEQEQGNGGDSNFDCEEIEDLHGAAEDVKKFRLIDEAEEDDDSFAFDSERNYILIDEGIARDGIGSVMNVACIPEDWQITKADVAKKEHGFVDVDNPGDWNRFTFCPVFKCLRRRRTFWRTRNIACDPDVPLFPREHIKSVPNLFLF